MNATILCIRRATESEAAAADAERGQLALPSFFEDGLKAYAVGSGLDGPWHVVGLTAAESEVVDRLMGLPG